MKARLPSEQRTLSQYSINLIRNCLTASLDLAAFERFGYGAKKLQRLHDRLWLLEKHFDKSYSGNIDLEIESLRGILKSHKMEYGQRKGSGGKVITAKHHDLMLLLYLLAANQAWGFGGIRCQRLFDAAGDTIKYTNKTFDGHPEQVLISLRSRVTAYCGEGTYMEWERHHG